MAAGRRAALLLVVTSAIASAAENERCLWMNAATAAGALGGPVSEHFSPSLGHQDIDGICTFASTTGTPPSELHIEVRTLASAAEFAGYRDRCAEHVAVRGIGNEAFSCAVKSTDPRERTWEIIGRVRTRLFSLRLRLFDSTVTTKDGLEKTRRLTDILAGNLF